MDVELPIAATDLVSKYSNMLLFIEGLGLKLDQRIGARMSSSNMQVVQLETQRYCVLIESRSLNYRTNWSLDCNHWMNEK